MKITVNQLRRIIKEEVARTLGEARGQKAKNRIETLESEIEELEAKLEASRNKRKQTQKDENEQERLESELDELHQELLVARDRSMKESRRRSGAINEITEQEMYDELINALIGALEDKLSDPDTQAKFLANLRGAAGVEVSPETLAREEEARKNMKDTGKKFKFLP